MSYLHLDRLIERAKKMGAQPVAVAYPCNLSSLEAAIQAAKTGLIKPILIGPKGQITKLAKLNSICLVAAELIDTGDDPNDAATMAVHLCKEGTARMIMKGSLHTDELLAAVVSKTAGLRTSRRISHAFVLDIPEYPKPLMLTDCVVNINPTLMEKRDIIQNAIDLSHILGVTKPNVAILSSVEIVNPAIQSSLDAAALTRMADRGQITGAVLDGPLAFDVAISSEAALTKGLVSTVAGHADILVVSGLDVGNALYKQLVYLAKSECAGVILGARVPIILTSRADSIISRLASCALGVIKSFQDATGVAAA